MEYSPKPSALTRRMIRIQRTETVWQFTRRHWKTYAGLLAFVLVGVFLPGTVETW